MGGQVAGITFGIFNKDFVSLTPEMEKFLKAVEGDKWYPVEDLKRFVAHVQENSPDALEKIGQHWAHSGTGYLKKLGIRDPASAVMTAFSHYKKHHKGSVSEVGTLICTETPNKTIMVNDYSIYRCDIMIPFWCALISAMGGQEVEIDHPPKMCCKSRFPFCRYEIAWRK